MEYNLKTIIMKELPKSFVGEGQVRGFEFAQVKASNFGYVYRVSDAFSHSWYEVFTRKENLRFGCMSYPRQEAFGIWAWNKDTLEGAEKKLASFEFNKKQQIVKTVVPNTPVVKPFWKQLNLFDTTYAY